MLIDSYVLHSMFDINFQGQNRKGNKTLIMNHLQKLKTGNMYIHSVHSLYSSKVPTFTIVWIDVCVSLVCRVVWT